MNACHQSMYKGKQKLIEQDFLVTSMELPKIEEYIKQLSQFPTHKLEHILVDDTITDESKDADNDIQVGPIIDNITIHSSSSLPSSASHAASKSLPDCIINGWLYMGDHSHCKSLEILKELGITHILTCSDSIPTYFIHNSDINITYARIPITDHNYGNLYNHLYAAKQFIDLCNPLENKQKKKHKKHGHSKKILIHCEMGISRSAAVVIGYLLSSKVRLNEDEKWRLQFIQGRLDEFERDETNFYKVKEVQDDNIVFMKLNEAYYYTQSCRGIIEPNLGFCKQLEKWEKIFHGKRSTLQDLPKYTPIGEGNDTKLGKTVKRLQIANDSCNCIVL